MADEKVNAEVNGGESLPAKAILVIGMHRAGTSATAGALQKVGIPLGSRLYKGHKGINEKGYFEHSDIADLNEELLLSMGSTWDDIAPRQINWESLPSLTRHAELLQRIVRRDFSRQPIWALKDPRIPRLLPVWLQILSRELFEPVFLFSMRSPEAVSKSLERRDGFSKEKSHLLWLLHYLEAEHASRGYNRVFVSYDRFLDDPVAEFERAEEILGMQFPISPRSAARELNGFLSKNLRNYDNAPSLEVAGTIEQMAMNLYQLLEPATRGEQPPNELAINNLRHQVDKLYESFPSVLLEHMSICGKRHGELQLLANRLVRSWSWGFGKPIRFIERLLKRDV